VRFVHDPGHQALHRAVRVVLVAGGLFAFGLEVLGNEEVALFAMFGGFAMLGFADFGGPPATRARAYLALAAAGAVLVALGTAVSETWWLAALVMVLAGATIRFVGFFGGAYRAAVSPAILAYVLAATSPVPFDAVGDRLAGWVVAGLAATLAGLVVLPRHERRELARAVAEAADAVAAAVRARATPSGVPADVSAAASRALDALDTQALVPLRAAGPGETDAAMRFVIDELRRVGALALGPRSAAGRWSDPGGELDALASLAARALTGSARALRGDGEPPDAIALERDREAHQERLLGRIERALSDGALPDHVVDWLDEAFGFRVIAYLATSVAANTSTWRGVPFTDARELVFPVEQPCDLRGRVAAILRAHLDPRSVWFQDSVRAGLALGAAVAVAGAARIDHGFWVVLGTLSVLRSNAFDTGSSALGAAAGTAAGFAASVLVFAVVGFDAPALWAIALSTLFLAAYVPQAVGFVAGQAMFTVALVTIFNLVQPEGWRTGLVRIEDIALGAGISFVVALLFWPRRADRRLCRSIGELFGGLARLLPAAVHALRAGVAAAAPESRDAVREEEKRARAALVVLVEESAKAPRRAHPWDRDLLLGALVRTGTDSFARSAAALRGGGAAGPELAGAFDALEREAGRVAVGLRGVQEEADAAPAGAWHGAPPVAVPLAAGVAARTRRPVEAALAVADAGRSGRRPAITAALCREWLVAIAAALDQVRGGSGVGRGYGPGPRRSRRTRPRRSR
jgi:uncharacterized membrane protein YccC